MRPARVPTFLLLAALTGACACPRQETPSPAPSAPLADEADTVPALAYRRLAWTDDMRRRYWLDETYVPSLGIAFNFAVGADPLRGDPLMIPRLHAFRCDSPPTWTEEPAVGAVVKPETREIRIPKSLADAVSAKVLGDDLARAFRQVQVPAWDGPGILIPSVFPLPHPDPPPEVRIELPGQR